MADPEDIIEYLRTLSRGFDVSVFDSKVGELNRIVTGVGLSEEDFVNLTKVWLNLSIAPVNKWINVGICVIPPVRIDDALLRHVLCWVFTNYKQTSITRTKFVLGWITAAMDHSLINSDVLDEFYELLFHMFKNDRFSQLVVKLLYKLTKPHDVTRSRVSELLHLLNLTRGKKKSELQVLLSLFKSYKPECVPEAIPALAVQNVFPKIHNTLVIRMKEAQRRLNRVGSGLRDSNLNWQISATLPYGKSRLKNQVVPDLEFLQIGSKLYSDNVSKKNYLHFKQSEEVLFHCLREPIARPSQLISLLCNETGCVILSLLPTECHSIFSHRIQHVLHYCFLEDDTVHTEYARTDFLNRLADFQYVIQQAIPVVSNFMTAFMQFWDGVRYAKQIWRLLEWITFDTYAEMELYILKPIEVLFVSYSPIKRYMVLKSLARMYTNLCFTMNKKRHIFFNMAVKPSTRELTMGLVTFIEKICKQSLQVYPTQLTVHLTTLWTYDCLTRTEYYYNVANLTICPMLLTGMVLLSPSAIAIETLARLLLDYNNYYKKFKKNFLRDVKKDIKMIEAYTEDIVNALWFNEAFSSNNEGVIFKKCREGNVKKLNEMYKTGIDSFCINTHLAFAPYTYVRFDMVDDDIMTKDIWLATAIAPMFPNLNNFIARVVVSS